MRAVSFGQRPDLDERWDETVGPAWPEFLLHGSTVNQHWHHLFDDHPAFQLYLIDETTDEVLGVANTLPFAWDGEIEHLRVGSTTSSSWPSPSTPRGSSPPPCRRCRRW